MRATAPASAMVRRYIYVCVVILLFAPLREDVHGRRIGDERIAEGVARERVGGLLGDGSGDFSRDRRCERVPAGASITICARHITVRDVSGRPEKTGRFSRANKAWDRAQIQVRDDASGSSGATRAACSPGSLLLAFNSRFVHAGERVGRPRGRKSGLVRRLHADGMTTSHRIRARDGYRCPRWNVARRRSYLVNEAVPVPVYVVAYLLTLRVCRA